MRLQIMVAAVLCLGAGSAMAQTISPQDAQSRIGQTVTVEGVVKDYPFSVVATTLRKATTATLNDWGAICYADGSFYQATHRPDLEIFDRVGGGDSFASGLIYGFLTGQGPQWAVECGAAHGALAMSTPGDTTMVTLKEVTNLMKGVGARIAR